VHDGLRRSILSYTYSTPAFVLGKSTSPTAGQRKELDIERMKSEYYLDGQTMGNPQNRMGNRPILGSQSFWENLFVASARTLGRLICATWLHKTQAGVVSQISTETGTFTAGRESLRGAPGADSTPLEVHHKSFRGQSGEGTEQKLIALCFDCHAHAHHRTEYLRRSHLRDPWTNVI
jgi:HNH endonuclease